MNLPEEEVEFLRQRDAIAARLSEIKSVIIELERRSGEAFVRRRDEVAQALRDATMYFTSTRDRLDKELKAFID